MAITESSRNELHNTLTNRIGEPAASTLMEMLPPVGWADVATKRDLDHLAAVTKGDLDRHAAVTKGDLDRHAAATKGDLDRITTKIDHLAELMHAELSSVVRHRDLRQLTYTVLAFNLTLVLAILGATGLS